MDYNQLSKELKFNFSRSGGKGGQNVNKVETKVELIFNIVKSKSIPASSKEILNEKFKNRIDKEGNLRLVSQSERTQAANRKKVLNKFCQVIYHSLKKPKKRIQTKITHISKARRLGEKRKHSLKKKERRTKVSLE